MATHPAGRRARFSFRALTRGWPWYYETTPVFRGEVLLRTVPNSIGYYTADTPDWKINPNAFEPRPVDLDGISLFRLDFVTEVQLAARSTSATGVRVARISVREILAHNLSVTPSPNLSGPAGHVVIPEMPFVKKTAQTKDRKNAIRDLAAKLSLSASRNRVYAPPGLPDSVARSRD